MQLKNTMSLLLAAVTMTPLMVQAASADSCHNMKVVRTSYQRISPRTVKKTTIYEKTNFISKAPSKHIVRRVAHVTPRTHTYTTTTRTTSMFIPTSSFIAPVAVVKPVVIAQPVAVVKPVVVTPATTYMRSAAVVPATTTLVRSAAVVPATTTVVRSAAFAPATTTVIKTQSVVAPAAVLSTGSMIAQPGETVVYKERHGKLKQVGTLKPVVLY